MKHLSSSLLKGRLLTLPINIRLGWKGLPGTNTLAYFENPENYGSKKFYSTGPWCFKNRNARMGQVSQSPGRPFQPYLMFEGKAK